MTLKQALSVVAVVVAVLLAIVAGRWLGSRENQRFLEQDMARVAEIVRLQKEVSDGAVVVKDKLAQVSTLQKDKQALQSDLQKARNRWNSRKEPKALDDCLVQLSEGEELVTSLEQTLSLEELTSQVLSDALVASSGQVDNLERAWSLERKRVQELQKQQKKDKRQKVFVGIGGGVAGLGTGLLIGTFTK